MSALCGDAACDPPLGATARALAVARADDVVYGLGALALERGARQLTLRVRHDDAAAALARAIAKLEARVELVHLPDAWPPSSPSSGVAVDAAALVGATDRVRGRPARAYVTVAGAVEAPEVCAAPPDATVEELVARARPCDPDWVAVAGGAPAGRLVGRTSAVGDASLVLVLPAGHPVVRRLRTPLSDWLWRAASACEGCRACSDACAGLAPHEVVWTLSTLRDDGVGLAQALACTACGLCDAVCPSSLSPRALVADVRDRMRAMAGAGAAVGAGARGLDVGLLTLRLGLGDYARAPVVNL
jgi:hypothetical protein